MQIFPISARKRYGYSLEAPYQGVSNEYPQHTFLWRNKKSIRSKKMSSGALMHFEMKHLSHAVMKESMNANIKEKGQVYIFTLANLTLNMLGINSCHAE